MRLVLDTNVVVSALLWNGNPRRLLRVGRGEGVMLFTSAPLLAELTEVLLRPKFEKKIAASLLSVDQLVDLYAEDRHRAFGQSRPPRHWRSSAAFGGRVRKR